MAAREDARTDRLKPSPYLLHQALHGRRPAAAVFVGDSITDLHAAETAAVPFIGYANKPDKLHGLARSAALTTSMTLLVEAH
ncbi:HAD family hydrolase [Actinokineospora baliensis]|uniref:HAD family hydrolase n=1 Tax=Actinokineospora baliensis TaxID=547056 RepID=UPI003556DF80